MKNKISKKAVIIGCVIVVALVVIASIAIYAQKSINSGKVIDDYMACGCGGCGGSEPKLKYYSKSQGEEDEYNQAIKNDTALKQNKSCVAAGCSLCTKLILVE